MAITQTTPRGFSHALSVFSARFHSETIKQDSTAENHISSPLGAWLLTAITSGANAEAYSPQAREELENILGMSLEAAYETASMLLENAPPVIKTSAAAWRREHIVDSRLADWWNAVDINKAMFTKNSIPDQTELDAWTYENSLGLMKEFPVNIKELPDPVLILATLLATKIEWAEPFNVAENNLSWGTEKVLHASKRNRSHQKQLLVDSLGELYALHSASSSDGLSVYSLIAADPNLPRERVIATLEAYVSDNETLQPATLSELPSESSICKISTTEGYQDSFEVYLPAWSASSRIKLDSIISVDSIKEAITLGDEEVNSLQVAVAEYTKKGFEAAALSTIVLGARSMPQLKTIFDVSIEFNHPYAVVASYSQEEVHARETAVEQNPWKNLPVFCAWVQVAKEA